MIVEIFYSTAVLSMFGVAAGLIYQYYLSDAENRCVSNESTSEMLRTELNNRKFINFNKHKECRRRNFVHGVKQMSLIDKASNGGNNVAEENNRTVPKKIEQIRNNKSFSDAVQDYKCKEKYRQILFVEKNNNIADINKNTEENKILTKHINYEKFPINNFYEEKKILNINVVNTLPHTKDEIQNICNVSTNHTSDCDTEAVQKYLWKTEKNCAENSSVKCENKLCVASEYDLASCPAPSVEEIRKFDNTKNISYKNHKKEVKNSNKLSEISHSTMSYNNVSGRNNLLSKKFNNCNNSSLCDNTKETKLNPISYPTFMLNGACNIEVNSKAGDVRKEHNQETQNNGLHIKEIFDSTFVSGTDVNNPLLCTSEINEPWKTLESSSSSTILHISNEIGNDAKFAERQRLYNEYMKLKMNKTDRNYKKQVFTVGLCATTLKNEASNKKPNFEQTNQFVQKISSSYIFPSKLFSTIRQNINAKTLISTKVRNFFASQQKKFPLNKANFKDVISLGFENNAEFGETLTDTAIENSLEVFEDIENVDIQQEHDLCKGCTEVVANAIYNPCGHCYLCMNCAVTVSKMYQKCCLCHTKVISFKEVNN